MLGTSADDRRKDSRARPRRQTTQAHSVTGEGNAIRVRKEGAAKDRQTTWHTGEFARTLPAPEGRNPRLDPMAKTQQGWPSWLMAVAGEAIGDWTPRRASSFEKLAKVLIGKL